MNVFEVPALASSPLFQLVPAGQKIDELLAWPAMSRLPRCCWPCRAAGEGAFKGGGGSFSAAGR